jgi:hypothetical protein
VARVSSILQEATSFSKLILGHTPSKKMGLSSKQLKSTLEKYGYTPIRFFYAKKYYVLVECVCTHNNIPVMIQLEEVLKFRREEDIEDYKLKKIDRTDLTSTFAYKTRDAIDVDAENFEEELRRQYHKNNKIQSSFGANSDVIPLYEQCVRLNELLGKTAFSICLLEHSYLAMGSSVYEIRNVKDSNRQMYISFSLSHLYDNANTVHKTIDQIYKLVEDTLFDNFKVQLDATYALIQNYKVDFGKIQQCVQHKNALQRELNDLNTQLSKYTSRRATIKGMLDKNRARMSEFEYTQLSNGYAKELASLQFNIQEYTTKVLDVQAKQKFLFLKLDQIFYDNVKYLQFIRKNLTEINNLFS